MTIILGIFDFYFGENPPSSSINWTQLTIALIGPLAGFLTAWAMSNRTQRKNRENVEHEKKITRQEKYLYFVSMVKEVPKIISGQVILYQNHIKVIVEDPLQYHPPDSFIITTLKRLSEEKDNEQYLHSFLSTSAILDKQKCIDTFKDLYSYIDYKYHTITKGFEYHDRVKAEKEKIIDNYIIAVKELEDFIGNYLRDVKDITDNKEEIVVLEVYKNYVGLKHKSKPNDFRLSYDSFAIPLAINLLQLNLEEYSENSRAILSKSRTVKVAFDLFIHKNKFEIINFNNLIVQLKAYDKEFYEILNQL